MRDERLILLSAEAWRRINAARRKTGKTYNQLVQELFPELDEQQKN